jgi:YVTN family beta-propeller protein
MNDRSAVLIALFCTGYLISCGDDEPTGSAASEEVETDGGDAGPSDDADAEEPDREDEFDADANAPDEGDLFSSIRCEPVPPPEALWRPGQRPDNTVIHPGGRELTPAGTNLRIEGFPTQVVLSPNEQLAYITSASADDRRLFVVDIESAAVLQEIDRGQASYGLAVSPSGDRVYASGGKNARVDVYTVEEDGTLTLSGAIETGGYPSGLALSPDGETLWVGLFNHQSVLVTDTIGLSVGERIIVSHPVWDLMLLPSRGELYVSSLTSDRLNIIDIESNEVLEPIEVGSSPAGMARMPDDSRVWVAVSGIDRVLAIDPSDHSIVGEAAVAELDLVDAEGEPLANSNVNDVEYDETRGRLYATRGADNAVTVLEADDLEMLGAFPTAWYPTGLTVSQATSTLVVIEGKGFGSGPNLGRGSKDVLTGSVTLVDLTGLNLARETEAVVAQFNRPRLVFPFECDGDFPVPTRPDRVSPIEHVILIVKENKTFDCVFGDLEDMDVEADPDLVRWGEEITPNQHALARQFAFSDHFYDEVENSDMGHLLLTATHLTEYIQRIWAEARRDDSFQGFQITAPATPESGNFFTHLINHDVDLQIYGEIVGMFAESDRGRVPMDYTDWAYPGGPAVNYTRTDESKARYIIGRIEAGRLAAFTYVLFPNDHTNGTREGTPSPESMVADNDYAVGLLVEALSQSEFWESTVIFIVEDDPQGCQDHIDSHRVFALVISPWAHREYVSHVNYGFHSVFATIERILGVPPLGRPDASASPMWDMFADRPDPAGYTAIERRIEPMINQGDEPGARESLAMDFRSPDRNPDLGTLLDAYRLWRMGRITREEADRRIAEGIDLSGDVEELEEEANEEAIAFEASWARYEIWLRERNLPIPELPLGPMAR